MMFVSLGLGAVMAMALIVTLSLLTGGKVTSGETPPVSALVGTRLPAVSGVGLNGGMVHAPWTTGHPTVVVFYASFCEPCKRELPKVTRYLDHHDLGRVRIIGVDATDTRDAGTAFSRASGVTFPVMFDPSADITSGIFHFVGLPETVYVSGTGEVRQVTTGATTVAGLKAGIALLR